MIKLLLFILIFFSSYNYAETLYHPNEKQSLFSLTKTVRQTKQGVELILTLKNTTDEINGNGLEQIVEGIEIQYPLPPAEWLALADSEVSRGKIEFKDQELAMCQPAMLGRLKGFEKGNETLHAELAERFKDDILPRMKPTLSYWLVGHTDTKGRASYNKKLSLNRAEAVKQILANAGFETAHITAFGEGENSPLTLEQDEASHELNRRVEIYPKQHVWAYWQLSQFKPDEQAELRILLKPSSWAESEALEKILHSGICYQSDTSHQYTIPTHAQLQLHSYIKPARQNWTQTADVSSCDSVMVELKIENHGARSARQMYLVDELPSKWELNNAEAFTQRREKTALYLDWTHPHLYPNKSIKLQYQILPPFLVANSRNSELEQQLCLQEHDSTLLNIGCFVAKQLQETVQPKIITQQHYVNLTAKGYPSVQAQNTIRWHTPSLVLQVLSPQIQYAGETVEQTLVVTNNGNIPIRQLKVIANLPKDIHSLLALYAREKTEKQVTWILGELPPQAQNQATLSFIPQGNISSLFKTQFTVYDQVYGLTQCVRADTQIQTLVKSLVSPLLALKAEYETIAMGKKMFYQVELKNPNSIDLAYSITGKLDPRVWEQTRQSVIAIRHGQQKQSTTPLQVNTLSSGEILVMDNIGRKVITIPAKGRLLFNFTLRAKSISEQVLQAIAANLASQFSVTELQMQAVSHHGLIKTEQYIKTVVYQ